MSRLPLVAAIRPAYMTTMCTMFMTARPFIPPRRVTRMNSADTIQARSVESRPVIGAMSAAALTGCEEYKSSTSPPR